MEQQVVYLYIFDTLADWEPGHAVGGINDPESQLRPGRYRVETFGLTRTPVTTTGGIRILPDRALDEVGPGGSAMLILPGGHAWDEGRNMEVVPLARRFLEAGVPVAAICGATAGLARGGLLDDRSHTSNMADYLKATGYKGGALYREEAFVSDRGLITAAGTRPVDFAYAVFQRLELYAPAVLEAWRGLFKTGDPKYYQALVAASEPGGGAH
jgi:putative intracellular protease/amidase